MNRKILEVCVCCLAVVLTAKAQTPVIVSQPQSITINNASTANFSVTASNAASYQWRFDGTNISGATNPAMLLDDVNSSQAGSYTVVVTSSGGVSVTNQTPAVLTLVPGTIVQLTISRYADGSSSNIVAQLFDHDKPATAANFIHYITSGAYSNMFFDRCVPGFILQGGTYDADDRTNTSPGVYAYSLSEDYSGSGANSGVPFPDQVDSEFGNGPFIPNTFGTLAMALSGGNPNSATSAFFINLADNSANLDSQSGGFTVFGRILSGTNVLEYYNTLQANGGGLIDYQQFAPSVTVTTLPVNYIGTNEPGDANLYFCDFTLMNPPVYNTNLVPTVAVTSPPNGQVFTNGGSIVVQGIAGTNQWTGLALVFCALYPQTGIYAGQPFGTDAIGTTNWSLPFSSYYGTLPPGQYTIGDVSQDGYGILGVYDYSHSFTVLANLTIVTNGIGTVQISPAPVNLSGIYLYAGTNYTITAVPGPGQTFYAWSNGIQEFQDPSMTISGNYDQTWTVTFDPATPANMSVGVSGGNLTLTWPQSYTGWLLQAQTNAAGIGANWVTVSGGAATNSVVMPIGRTNPAVFFRLEKP
jgi:cyclophilin family peptidyl-prolyl cis-trans isomerase